MGELVLKNALVLIGSSESPTTTLTGHVKSAAVNYTVELQDKTAMMDGSRGRIAGLKDWNMTIEFNQDFGSTDYDKFFHGLVGTESTNSWLDIRPTTAKGGGTNPRYCGRGLLEGYSPLSGSVGDLAVTSLTFQGDGDLSRLVTTGPL